MKDKIKKIIKNEQQPVLWYLIGIIVGITGYTFACKQSGYRMVRPMSLENGVMRVQTVSGKILRFREDTQK